MPTVYLSTDPGAPVFTLANGPFNVLDACLVNGYGTKPAAGWTKEFTGTDKAAYRLGGGGALRPYLRVERTSGTESRLRGYESMTGVDTGTNPAPSLAQIGGAGLTLGPTSGLSAVSWAVIAEASGCYFALFKSAPTVIPTYVDDSGNNATSMFYFGKFTSLLPSDSHNWCLSGGMVGATGGSFSHQNPLFSAGTAGHTYLGRDYLGVVTSKRAGRGYLGNMAYGGIYGLAFPDVVSGQLLMQERSILTEPCAGGLLHRGYLPGVHSPLCNLDGMNGSTFIGAGALAGKSYLIIGSVGSYNYTRGYHIFNTSDAWGL